MLQLPKGNKDELAWVTEEGLYRISTFHKIIKTEAGSKRNICGFFRKLLLFFQFISLKADRSLKNIDYQKYSINLLNRSSFF